MKDFFKPEDFAHRADEPFISSDAASIANEKLADLISSWPVVYGEIEDNRVVKQFCNTRGPKDTHAARLACAEEIIPNEGRYTYVSTGHTIKGETMYKRVKL